jgi:hypothetical protein
MPHMFAYKHLVGYLERYTILHFKRMHVRFHRIKRPDITPFLHTHPFHYLSIVLWGGYTEFVKGEMRKHGFLSFIRRSASEAHRIVEVKPGTLTLFFTWKTKDRAWSLQDDPSGVPAPEWVNYPQGVYLRQLYGRTVYSKFDRFWHKAADSYEEAQVQTSPSIDQSTAGLLAAA